MKYYCVVYMVLGTHHSYRCYAENKREAQRQCRKSMGVTSKNIIEVYEDEE